MDILQYKKAAVFLTKFYSDRKELIRENAPITKPVSPMALPIHDPFPRATAEEVGIESDRLLRFLEEYAEMTELRPHALMIMKDDKIILETDFYPYRRDIWHVSHSLCKSITALAVGLLVDDGVLTPNDRLIDIFPKRAFNIDIGKVKELTIRTLLNMTSSVSFNEFGSALEEDWVSAYFSASFKNQPGTAFHYNSMNTYMLSACIREKTGKDMFELLKERLFTPMEITEVFWEKCPKGITKGGWGLYMKLEDLMKFASLMLRRGVWKGKRLISAEWIDEMSQKQIDTPEYSNKYGYGYQVWRSVRKDSYQFNGMLGQNLILFPDIHMAIGVFGGNAEFFPNSSFMALIERHFGDHFIPSESPLKPAKRAAAALEKYCRALSLPPIQNRMESKKRMASFAPLIGKRYTAEMKNISILPVMMSIFHGNFGDRIDKIAFSAKDNVFYVSFSSEKGAVSIPFSPDGTACYFDLSENGEHFSAASIAKMTQNEDGIPVFKISVYFLESTSVRHIKFFFGRTKTTVRFSEDPTGLDMLATQAPALEEAVNKNKMAKNMLSRFDFGLVEYNVERIFSPSFEITEDKDA